MSGAVNASCQLGTWRTVSQNTHMWFLISNLGFPHGSFSRVSNPREEGLGERKRPARKSALPVLGIEHIFCLCHIVREHTSWDINCFGSNFSTSKYFNFWKILLNLLFKTILSFTLFHFDWHTTCCLLL